MQSHVLVGIGIMAFFIGACGGGASSGRDFRPTDMGQETIGDAAVEVTPEVTDVEDAVEEEPTKQDLDLGGKEDEALVPDDAAPSMDEGVGIPEAGDAEVLLPECPCDETVVAWVCGIDGQDYVNDQCAKCAICQHNSKTCIGCTGTKDCDPTDPMGPNGWIKQKAKCEVCVCDNRTECERLQLQYPCGPFCDFSETTWNTPCEMKQHYDCSPDWDENIYYFGACGQAVCEPCETQPYDPVCGSDGVTYNNYCTLMNCGPQGVTLAYLGRCLDASFCPQCAPLEKKAVCGDDGVTYANECAATCAGHQIAYYAACCVFCEPGGKGVCGKDFKTYPNDCVLLCLGIEKAYDGPCICPCTTEGPKVCGKDGKTYYNQCWLDCLQVEKLYDGACQGECPQCPKVFEPVCGADNVTYPNSCWLQCKQINLKNQGVCQACKNICGTPDNPVGGLNPVCGPDGITYPSSCFPVKCVGYSEQQVSQGPCL